MQQPRQHLRVSKNGWWGGPSLQNIHLRRSQSILNLTSYNPGIADRRSRCLLPIRLQQSALPPPCNAWQLSLRAACQLKPEGTACIPDQTIRCRQSATLPVSQNTWN